MLNMCTKEAIYEWAKHFTANLAAGMLHGLIGFSIALILGAFIPVQIPIDSLQQLLTFALTVGAGAGVLGSVLAVETDGSKFKATRVIEFIRRAAYPSSRNNGSTHTLSSRLGLVIHKKKSWQDYIFYF